VEHVEDLSRNSWYFYRSFSRTNSSLKCSISPPSFLFVFGRPLRLRLWQMCLHVVVCRL